MHISCSYIICTSRAHILGSQIRLPDFQWRNVKTQFLFDFDCMFFLTLILENNCDEETAEDSTGIVSRQDVSGKRERVEREFHWISRKNGRLPLQLKHRYGKRNARDVHEFSTRVCFL